MKQKRLEGLSTTEERFSSIAETNEDVISNANTEDSLLSSKPSSETISAKSQEDCDYVTCCSSKKCSSTEKGKEKTRSRCGPRLKLITGFLIFIWGIGTVIYTPFRLMMNERLRMVPGFPAYEWWKNPPDEVLLRVYLFNISNPKEFLSGVDSKLNLSEVGPIVYMEKLIHSNVTFNDNNTMTYVATRKAIYLPDLNTIDLNQTLYVPNLAVLGMASYLADTAFFTKWGFNLLVRNAGSQPIVKTTVYNYLWNFSDPVLDTAQRMAPKMVPVKNMAILARIYDKFDDQVTVYIGSKHSHQKYFLIDRYDGSEYLPGHGDQCEDQIVNSTEGVAYPQFLTKNSTVKYWRKTVCKVTELFYKTEEIKFGVTAYRFELPNSVYNRTKPKYTDCYRSFPVLEDGLSDVSKCYYNYPMAISLPHFNYGDEKLKTYVNGLRPNMTGYRSYVLIEPTTGIPLESRASSQSNLVIRNLEGFSPKINRFSDIILPLFWLEYNQVGLPWKISALMYFTVVILPYLQKVFSAFLIVSGSVLMSFAIKNLILQRKNHLPCNKALQFERELFLGKIYHLHSDIRFKNRPAAHKIVRE